VMLCGTEGQSAPFGNVDGAALLLQDNCDAGSSCMKASSVSWRDRLGDLIVQVGTCGNGIPC
jgi:hypothetical protein